MQEPMILEIKQETSVQSNVFNPDFTNSHDYKRICDFGQINFFTESLQNCSTKRFTASAIFLNLLMRNLNKSHEQIPECIKLYKSSAGEPMRILSLPIFFGQDSTEYLNFIVGAHTASACISKIPNDQDFLESLFKQEKEQQTTYCNEENLLAYLITAEERIESACSV